MERLTEQARRLSSGTIASLTGETRYEDIELIQDRFVHFCGTLADPPLKWQDAWKMFEEYRTR